jgi:hypothetical protein
MLRALDDRQAKQGLCSCLGGTVAHRKRPFDPSTTLGAVSALRPEEPSQGARKAKQRRTVARMAREAVRSSQIVELGGKGCVPARRIRSLQLRGGALGELLSRRTARDSPRSFGQSPKVGPNRRAGSGPALRVSSSCGAKRRSAVSHTYPCRGRGPAPPTRP